MKSSPSSAVHQRLLGLALLLACGPPSAAQAPGALDQEADAPAAVARPAEPTEDPSTTSGAPVAAPRDAGIHSALDTLLGRFVKNGVVDYRGLSKDHTLLDEALKSLADGRPARFDAVSRKAFWINAYNAFTLRLILDHYGKIDGIKDISSGKRWKAKRWLVNGRRYSLDEIEHEILRPLGDPRVHFALVCASLSCPDLRSEAFLPDTLDTQLEDATRDFLSSPSRGLKTNIERGFFGGEDPNLYLSAIFDWFEADFEKTDGEVLTFVLRYARPEAVAFIRKHRDDLDIEYLDYDWSLNGS